MGKDKESMPGEGRGGKGKRRRKVSYLTINKIDTVDYKDLAILRRFINDRGKIVSSRQSGNTAKQQRMITDAIQKARELALLPFVVNDMTDRREYGPRRDRGERYDRGDRGGDRGERAPAAAEATAAPAAEAAPAEAATVE